MNVADSTSMDVNTNGDGINSLCTGLIPDALPEVQEPVSVENSQTGVSTKNVLSKANRKDLKKRQKDAPRWYALRATYGREKKACDYLVGQNVEAYCPTIKTVKEIGGKRKTVEESRIPNILFARGTEEEMKSFVYDNVNCPHLRFYYRHFHEGAQVVKKPLIVPERQIESLRIVCASEADDLVVVPPEVCKFRSGQTVHIIGGVFKGVTGKVARYQGQQRVAVIIDGLLTVATAYVPSAFLKKTE